MLFSFNVALNCGDPTSNLTLENKIFKSGTMPSQTTYPIQTDIICMSGYMLSDFSQYVQISCDSNGKWTASISCTSMFRY